MNALFALVLLSSPLRATVVAPVESGVVSPAGPTVTGLPAVTPVQSGFGAPAFGGVDLRGALPMLPAPVPGLAGPSLNFIGQSAAAEAAPAAVTPAAGTRKSSPAPEAQAANGRATERTPSLPGKNAPGSNALAIARDRKRAASTPESTPALGSLTGAKAAEPRVDAGRKFFDLGSDLERGDVSDAAREGADSFLGGTAADGRDAGIARGSAGDSRSNSGRGFLGAFGGGKSAATSGSSFAEGETLQDAVASVPGAAAVPAPGGKVSFFRAASPNGELAASAGSVGAAVLGMPRPLSLDLSGSGLIVRVRAALGSALGSTAFVSEPAVTRPSPSTALLERGGMLEAFSVSRVHAEGGPSSAVVSSSVSGAARRVLVPAASDASASSVPSLWWALLALPLFAAALRRLA